LDTLEALERLQKLREAGVITDSEFNAQKEKILSGTNSPDAAVFHKVADNPSEYHAPLTGGKKLALAFLAFSVLSGGLAAGLYTYLNQDDEIPFSLPEQPQTDSQAASDASEENVEPENELSSSIPYEFEIEKSVETSEMFTITRYFLNNKSPTQVLLSSVQINKRDDCTAYIREKKSSNNDRNIISLSQRIDDGEITLTCSPEM
jgi:hypothetical protein